MLPDPASLTLPASLDIAAADPLLESLRQALPTGALVLDGSAVERAAMPCLQILAAAAITAREAGQDFQLSASPALAAAIADLGLTAAIPSATDLVES